MSISKSQIIEAIKAIPKEEFADVDDLLHEIVIITKIEKGLKELEEGSVISEDELDKAIEQW